MESYPDKEIDHEEDVESKIDLLRCTVSPSFARLHLLSALYSKCYNFFIKFISINLLKGHNMRACISTNTDYTCLNKQQLTKDFLHKLLSHWGKRKVWARWFIFSGTLQLHIAKFRYCHDMLSVVCRLPVTLMYCVKTNLIRIMQFLLQSSYVTLLLAW